jgi:hypothetical protein
MSTTRTREERLATAARAQRWIAEELTALNAPSLANDALDLARRIEAAPLRDAEATDEFPLPPKEG